MKALTIRIGRFFREEDGVTAIEYGLIAGIMSIIIIAAFVIFDDAFTAMFNRITAAMN